MGAAYASRFYSFDPGCIAFLASGERYQRLKLNGIIVNNKPYPIDVLTPEDIGHPADLIIVALKHQHLASALPDIRNQIGDNTIILSIMNGLDSEPMIAAAYGEEKVLFATAVGIDAQREGNKIHYTKGGTIFFGEKDNTQLSNHVKRVQSILEQANIAFQTPMDMMRVMWWKFMINVGINQASVLLRAPYGIFQTSAYAQQIMESAMREVITLAQPAGIDLALSDIQEWYTFMNTLDPDGKTSMLQDIEAGRSTEVDIFSGKVIALGKEFGLPTPVNEIFFNTIKAIEQQQQAPVT